VEFRGASDTLLIQKWMRVPFGKSLGLGTGLACLLACLLGLGGRACVLDAGWITGGASAGDCSHCWLETVETGEVCDGDTDMRCRQRIATLPRLSLW
jgi:hypothetical protein